MRDIRIGICALLTFSVLAHGAVEPWSETVLEIGAALLLLAWGLLFATGMTTRVRVNPLFWPVIGLWVVVLVQYMARLSAVPFLTKIELLKFFLEQVLVIAFPQEDLVRVNFYYPGRNDVMWAPIIRHITPPPHYTSDNEVWSI